MQVIATIARFVWAKLTNLVPLAVSFTLLILAIGVCPLYFVPYLLLGGLVGHYVYGHANWRLVVGLPFNLVIPFVLCWHPCYKFSNLRQIVRSPHYAQFVDLLLFGP